MKTNFHLTPAASLFNALRCGALAATLAATAVSASPGQNSADSASTLLARDGRVVVSAAGPYVEVGTFRIQVAAKLGQPTDRLADGTWLYRNFEAERSSARGTLVVRFESGRVSGLTLVTPAVATAMIKSKKPAPDTLVADRR